MPEAKPEANPAAGKAAEPKGPLFSKAGLLILLVACALCAGVPVALLLKQSAHPSAPAEEHTPKPEPPGTFKPPKVPNTVTLDPIKVPYRDSGQGGPRRSLTVTVALWVTTQADPENEHAPEELKKEDERRKKAVEKLTPWIRDRIIAILRGKGPEDFATNELVEQTQMQIKHAINDEAFEKQEVVQKVLFPDQAFN